MYRKFVASASCFLLALAAFAQAPIVIAHRGASGYVAEHTLEAYAMAHAMGADYIEPDLVLTKDGEFICLHDIHLESTTNVERVFPDRKRADGKWYAADLTLAEIKQLNAEERLPMRFPMGKSRFEVPTFAEMIELVQGLNATTGREAGIYPELKEPAWHAAQGLPMEEKLIAVLTSCGYAGKDAKVYVQCFEAEPLKKIRTELQSALPLILLMGGDAKARELTTETSLAEIASYANGIGPSKALIFREPEVVKRAHALGLQVHPYTLRADDLSPTFDSFEAEVLALYRDCGVDGAFTDHPDKACAVLRSSR